MISGRGEELLFGIFLALAGALLAWRTWFSFRAGEMPLYRSRLLRSEVGTPKFVVLTGLRVAMTLLLAVMAVDLLFGLHLRGR